MSKEPAKDPSRATVPTKFAATTPPLPSADYSYTVELVGTMQNALGKLTEAVESLKDQSKEHGRELKEISKDIHAAKVVGGFVILMCGVLGFFIKILVDYLAKK